MMTIVDSGVSSLSLSLSFVLEIDRFFFLFFLTFFLSFFGVHMAMHCQLDIFRKRTGARGGNEWAGEETAFDFFSFFFFFLSFRLCKLLFRNLFLKQ